MAAAPGPSGVILRNPAAACYRTRAADLPRYASDMPRWDGGGRRGGGEKRGGG